MRVKLIIIIISSFSFGLIPTHYFINDLNQSNNYDTDGLSSNIIIDIESLGNSVFLSTSNGIGGANYNQPNFVFYDFEDSNLPEGGNPAMVVKNNVIAVSGSATVSHAGQNHPAGTGVAYSVDAGNNWNYMSQSVDQLPNLWSCSNYDYDNVFFSDKNECGASCFNCDGESASCVKIYDYVSWGGQDEILHLSVTVPINNISYDLEIHGNYIYASSWAGGLRRFNYTLDSPSWEIIPLPMDNQLELLCGEINLDSYQINPVGDCDSEFDNHKAFSVFGLEDTLWVGTAGGINKGIVDGDCIDWTHLSSYQNSFFDDWVIGFENQVLDNGLERIWALTWDKESQGSIGVPSFSDNGGLDWEFPNQLVELGVKSYNISFYSNYIYLSTNQGLYISNNGEFWERFDNPVDYLNQQILSEIVYDAEIINDRLWIGTGDGVAVSENLIAADWMIYRFWNEPSTFDVYPNPFVVDGHNFIDGHGHVRFVYPGEDLSATIDIFDFSMDLVASIENPTIVNEQIEFIWNGFNIYSQRVENGVYFCRLNYNGAYKWVKLAVIKGA